MNDTNKSLEAQPVHLRMDIYNQTKHAQTIMKELGITYQHSTPQSMGDQWWFWNCENVPAILPEFLEVADWDPMEFIGFGLSKEDAEKIRDYKPSSMTPEHNPPKDPSLAETKVFPRLPEIYVFQSSEGDTYIGGKAIAEDGSYVASHSSSDETWLRHDLGVTSDWYHDDYRKHYPHGFRVVWVAPAEVPTHAGIQAAFAKHLAIAPAPQAPHKPYCHCEADGNDPGCPIHGIPPAPSPVLGDATALGSFAKIEASLERIGGFETNCDHGIATNLQDAFAELEAIKTKVQALMEAVAQAREALEAARDGFRALRSEMPIKDTAANHQCLLGLLTDVNAAIKALESPALVSIIQPDGGKV